jgi:hypothetical protein
MTSMVKCRERNGGVEPVAEFGGEDPLDLGHLVAGLPGWGEAHGGLLDRLLSGVGGHDDHHVAEVGLAAVVVGQRAVVHHLQQDVVDVGVCLFDLVEQQHAVRFLGDRLGQQSALVEADVARRRTDQARDRVPLHVFRHVEADEFVAEAIGELLGDLGLADSRRTRKKEAADGSGGIAETGTSHLDGPGEGVDGRILAKDHCLEVAVEVPQIVAVIGRDVRRGMRAILATISSMSILPISFFCFDLGRIRLRRPLRR